MNIRICPLCENRISTTIFSLTPQEIVSANWSYRSDRFNALEFSLASSYEIVRCEACDFVFAAKLPPDEFLSFVYDVLIDASAARNYSYQPSSIAYRMDYIATLLGLIKGPVKVIDFGCGFGPTLSLLSKIEGVEAIGYETSVVRVNQLRGRQTQIVNELDAVLAHGPYNVIILDNVLEHVPYPVQTIEYLRRICTDNAIVYISVPDMNKRYLNQQIALHKKSEPLQMDINPWEHLNYFDVHHLDSVMNKAGFFALKQENVPGEIRIGLRPEIHFPARLKNSLASLIRLARYAFQGDVCQMANRRFYQCRD